jgi:ethanolamine ammonia-lyase small subunit
MSDLSLPPSTPSAPAVPQEPSPLLAAVRARTPARILVGRAGASYRTATQLGLRQDHAAALDAVHAEVDLQRDFGADFVKQFGLLEVQTRASSKQEYLMRPDLGRQLAVAARHTLTTECPRGADLQLVVGDGLSAAAVAAHVPGLLPLLERRAKERGWNFARPFFVRYCRVGVLNDVGELLDPAVVVLLIGERPGLATAESLSAYMAFRPRARHTDAQRNLISNIHRRGVGPEEAAARIVSLADAMRRAQTSGVSVKEDLSASSLTDKSLSSQPSRLTHGEGCA